MKAQRGTLSLAGLSLVILLSGCYSPTGGAPMMSESASSAPAEALPAEGDAAALDRYIAAERAQLPKVMSSMPGLYSEVTVDGQLEEIGPNEPIPAGWYAVVEFDYTYAEPQDWSVTTSELDRLRPEIDSLCTSMVFPAMRQAGIEGPLGVLYSYGDGVNEYGSMWSHACTE